MNLNIPTNIKQILANGLSADTQNKPYSISLKPRYRNKGSPKPNLTEENEENKQSEDSKYLRIEKAEKQRNLQSEGNYRERNSQKKKIVVPESTNVAH